MNPSPAAVLAQRVRSQRVALGLTPQQLAARSRLGDRTIWNIEAAKHRGVSLTTIEQLAQALGVSVAFLLSEESSPAGTRLERLSGTVVDLGDEDIEAIAGIVERVALLRRVSPVPTRSPAARLTIDQLSADPTRDEVAALLAPEAREMLGEDGVSNLHDYFRERAERIVSERQKSDAVVDPRATENTVR